MPPPSAGTELPPPPPGTKTPPPTTQIVDASPKEKTPSPPSKRHRGRSSPPSPRSPAPPISPRRRSSSTPPPMERVTPEAEALAPASAPNRRRIVRSKLTYSAEKGAEANESNGEPIAIFWDVENCSVPKDIKPEDVYDNVIRVLASQQSITGSLYKFGAYGDFGLLPPNIKEGLQSSGIEVHQVPHKNDKDASDLVILTDMLFFALDNPLPASIVLISGDSDFAPSLHGLHERGYTVGVAIWSTVNSSPELTYPAAVVWDWPLIAHGHGFGVPRHIGCPEELNADMFKVLQATEEKNISLSQVPAEYCKHFCRPLVITNYNCTDLGSLVEKLDPNLFLIFGARVNKKVYLAAPEETGGYLDSGSSSQQAQDNECATYASDGTRIDDTQFVPTAEVNPCKKVIDVEGHDAGSISQVTPVPKKKKKKSRQRWHRH